MVDGIVGAFVGVFVGAFVDDFVGNFVGNFVDGADDVDGVLDPKALTQGRADFVVFECRLCASKERLGELLPRCILVVGEHDDLATRRHHVRGLQP
ncbi:MAG: hypothetical protein ACJAYI_002165, partial [Myxococcota bacterium]